MQSSEPSLTDILYFGSPNQTTNLLPTPSSYFPYSPSDLLQIQSSSTNVSALIPRFPFDFLGSDYKFLYLPCTPAHEIVLKTPLDLLPHCDGNPNILTQGFVKTNNKTGFTAFRSGKRSAIYFDKATGKFYRLKGCGNEESGFINSIGKVNLSPESQEIRGAHYGHTVKRELLMTAKIDDYLKASGFEAGNKSIGFIMYSEKIPEIDQTLENVFPKIPKFCGVFETLGEKRVATHLFQGFEAILGEIARVITSLEDVVLDLDAVFPKDRILKDGSFIPTPVPMEGDTSTGPEILIDLLTLVNEGKMSLPLAGSIKFRAIIPEITQNLGLKSPCSELFMSLMKDLLENQENDSPIFNDFFGLAGVLFARVGFEIGCIKRIFLEKRINWGYYFDHHPYLAHCNAHPNNFIVLHEKHQGENLLAPLDFDLAFEEKEFININYEDKTYGKFDQELFNQFLEQERISLELALTGMENMDNFKYYGLELKELDLGAKRTFEGLRIILRDVLRKYYLKGIGGEGFDVKGLEWKKQRKVGNLIKMALIVTNDCLG